MILELIHKIKWDKDTDPNDFVFEYRDKDRLRSLKFKDIMKIDEGVLVSVVEGQVTHIPAHRIKKIYEKGKLILNRPIV